METDVDLGIQLIKTIGSLALVLGLLLGTLYGVKRLGNWAKTPENDPYIQVLSRRHLDPKHSLIMVQSQDELFLIGLSPQGMHLLARLEENRKGTPASQEMS